MEVRDDAAYVDAARMARPPDRQDIGSTRQRRPSLAVHLDEAARLGAARETAFLGHDGVGGVFAQLLEDAPQDLGPTREQLQRIYRNEQRRRSGKTAEVRTDLRSIVMQGTRCRKRPPAGSHRPRA
ncbi:MAG: hypothetical protein U1E19_10060 [Rhodoblastus sp.]